jgi:hypothetical protein
MVSTTFPPPLFGCVFGAKKWHTPFQHAAKNVICVRLWCSVHGRQPVSATLFFGPAFNPLAPRRGEKRAIVAVAHHMLIILAELESLKNTASRFHDQG